MSKNSFSIENSFYQGEAIKCEIKYKKYLFVNQTNGFKAVFPFFFDEEFSKINSIILRLTEEYNTYSPKTKCKKIKIAFVGKKDIYVSVIIECFYDKTKKIKSLNFDTTTMLPLPADCLLKNLGITKKHLKKFTQNYEKRLIVLYDTVHFFCDKLRFFCIKKSNNEIVEFKYQYSKV